MFKVSSRWEHQSSIKVEWNLGKRCNYDCSYCPSSIHDNTSPHTDIEILKATVDKLVTLGKPVRLSFTGGEPTVHPKFLELIKYCNHKGISWISVTTNGTLPYEFYASLNVDQYVFRNAAYTLFARCLSDHIPATLRRIRWTEGDHDLFDDMRYHPDDLNWIKKQEATVQGNCVIDDSKIIHANDVIKLHLNKYKGWTCNAGIESLMINWDGDVHRATCRVGGSLGNIYEGNFVAPSEPVTCDRNFCTCAADIPLTKYDKNTSN